MEIVGLIITLSGIIVSVFLHVGHLKWYAKWRARNIKEVVVRKKESTTKKSLCHIANRYVKIEPSYFLLYADRIGYVDVKIGRTIFWSLDEVSYK